MNHMNHRTLIFLIIFLFPAILCSAEWFDGTVVKINPETKELAVVELDPILEVEEIAVVSIAPATTFSGAAGLNDVRVGDPVSIEVDYDEMKDSWAAMSVEVLEADT